jgi:hypothetical protein
LPPTEDREEGWIGAIRCGHRIDFEKDEGLVCKTPRHTYIRTTHRCIICRDYRWFNRYTSRVDEIGSFAPWAHLWGDMWAMYVMAYWPAARITEA